MSRLHPIPRFFLSLALGLAAAFGLQAREMVSVQRAEVNLRAGAGTQHEALWVLSRGWIFRPLVGKKAHHVVKGSVVNLRSSPSTRSRIVGKATRGEVLRTLERRSQWVKVQQDGGPRGWVARRLLWGW